MLKTVSNNFKIIVIPMKEEILIFDNKISDFRGNEIGSNASRKLFVMNHFGIQILENELKGTISSTF